MKELRPKDILITESKATFKHILRYRWIFHIKTSPHIPQLFQRHEDSIWDIIITVFSKIENQYESRHRTIMAKLAQGISNNNQTARNL